MSAAWDAVTIDKRKARGCAHVALVLLTPR